MDRLRHALTVAAVCALAADVRADHDHGAGHDHTADAGASLSASFGFVAARYRTMLYAGDYQGSSVGAAWSSARMSTTARITAYRITRNGRTDYGAGDVAGSVEVRLLGGTDAALGVAATLSAPTGNARRGLGMGHAMGMSSIWGLVATGRMTLSASFGYGRVLGGAGEHAEHGGSWPLVDPMNASELMGEAAAAVTLSRQLRTGLALAGAVPVPRGDGERARATLAIRVRLTAGPVRTDWELGAGVVGDPYTVRGLIRATVDLD